MATRNPKDSMKSTWRNDKSQWQFKHYIYEYLKIHQSDDRPIPVHAKGDKVPHVPQYRMHRYVLSWAVIPLVLHQLYSQYTGQNLSRFTAFLFYALSFKVIGIHQFSHLRHLGHTYGFLDGYNHPRDGVPDIAVGKVFLSLMNTSTFRPMFSIILAYNKSQTPLQMSWLALPLEIGLYGIVLDFFFYWYHRLMHEVDSLWQFHRTHHLTKRPNALLTLYADEVQEFFDIAGIPLMAYFTMRAVGLPMGFYEWWICQQYVAYAELSGHSGIRIAGSPPSTLAWLLQYFNSELVIEDHDLHHRQGWKKSGNYGKQTRLWDRVFGTYMDRIECQPENIDYVNTVQIPFI